MAISSLFGAKVKRVEDPKLITGQGIYVDDITLPDMLYMTVLRSPYAHAKINSIDLSFPKSSLVLIQEIPILGNWFIFVSFF